MQPDTAGGAGTPDPWPTDLLLVGTVFLDMVFADLGGGPKPGHELRTSSLGISPGGVANTAVAAARLGLSVRLEADIGDDANGDYLWSALTEEGIDLRGTRRLEGWATPVTVSLVYDSDRCMVTFERPAPTSRDAGEVDRDPWPRALLVSLGSKESRRAKTARARGAMVFADVGWDETERWAERDLDELRDVDVFLPNRVEAMSYTRTDSPQAAARRLAERVPLVVVKCGADGAVAVQSGDARLVEEPALDIPAMDPTGAGDVFDAAFIVSVLAGWSIDESLRFSNLCAGLSVGHHGGSLSAPTLGDVARWLAATPENSEQYAFLASFIEGHQGCEVPPRARDAIRFAASRRSPDCSRP